MNRDELITFLKQFREANHSKYHIDKMGVFGSAARNGLTNAHDLDVVVELKRADYFDLIGIKQTLEEQLRIPVDIVRYRDTMNRFLKHRIDEDAVYV